MCTLDDLLSSDNVNQAMATLLARRGGAGPDGMPVSEIADHWRANGLQIEEAIRSGRYRPAAAACFEVVTGSGKRREVASINAVDRLIERMLHQQLTRCLGSLFLPNSFASSLRTMTSVITFLLRLPRSLTYMAT